MAPVTRSHSEPPFHIIPWPRVELVWMACSLKFLANPVFSRVDCLVLCSVGVLQIQGHVISQLNGTFLGLVLKHLEASKSTGRW